MKRPSQRAWVITQEGPHHPTEVIGIPSARKSARSVKEHIEWLYALLHYYPETQLQFARYNKPEIPCEAKYWTTNTGIPVDTQVWCGDSGAILIGRLAKNITLIEDKEDVFDLQWTNPDRLECDESFPPNIKKIPGIIRKAPIHLPLRLVS